MFARTDRLMLRPGWMEDAPALAGALNDPAIARNLARVPSPYSMQDAEAFLARTFALPNLLIFLRTKGAPRLIGCTGLDPLPEGGAELGYWIARPYWGLGFATEAGRAMVEMARESLRLPRLVAGHALDNPASGEVLRKLGFRPTGRITARPSVGRGEPFACAELELELGEAARSQEVALAA